MRLWVNGRRLGVCDVPLVEEVPRTFRDGITQRKRWIAGFFQSLGTPLKQMGMTWQQRALARMNFVPCLGLALNVVGLPVGAWLLYEVLTGHRLLDIPMVIISSANILAAVAVVLRMYAAAWVRSRLVLDRLSQRIWFVVRVNPVCLIGYWLLWVVPLAIGLWMFLFDGGLTWQRTVKVDADHVLLRSEYRLLAEVGAGADARTLTLVGRRLYCAPQSTRHAPHSFQLRRWAMLTPPLPESLAKSSSACLCPTRGVRHVGLGLS